MVSGEAMEQLEPVEVDNRPTSVVVSVRLESDLARELTMAARTRGLRLSDVLREAARAFSARPGWKESLSYQVQAQITGQEPLFVRVGVPAWESPQRRLLEWNPEPSDAPAPWRLQSVGR